MKRIIHALVVGVILSAQATTVFATNRYFDDIVAESPSKRYKVVAKSPDNKAKTAHRAFQSKFVYTCTDTKTKAVLWTRKQSMDETESFDREASPISIFISDSGWTVIRTGWDKLIIVGRDGRNTGNVGILEDAFTEKEREKFVHPTTAGPMWCGLSHWYFAQTDGLEYFVVSPWWGRRIIIDLVHGNLAKPSKALNIILRKLETKYVLATLKGIVNGTLKKCADCGISHDATTVVHMAGRMNIKQAVPLLRELEDGPYIGSLVSGSGFFDKDPKGQVDPHIYQTFDIRQIVHLSLRRLGEKPGPYPCTQFNVNYKNYDKNKLYVPNRKPGLRKTHVGKLSKGMKPEKIINLLGFPDYVVDGCWHYDIDAKQSYTLVVSWSEALRVKSVDKKRPPLWQGGFTRDEDLAY